MLDHNHSNKSSPLSGSLPPAPGVRPLSEARAGSELVVVDAAAGPAGGRCLELGLIPGARVRVISCGDPMFLAVDSQRLAIARSCLQHILVASDEEPPLTSYSWG